LRGARLGGRLWRAGTLAEEETAVGKLFDEAALFQFGQHLEEGAAAGAANLEGAGEVLQRGGAVSKLKKTEDVIRAELRLPGHAKTPFRGAKERV
jgi:hypothetical protein